MKEGGPLTLVVRTLLFTVLLPNTLTVVVPYLILSGRDPGSPRLHVGSFRWAGLPLLTLGVIVYAACATWFGTVGRGTPAPWDPPRFLVRHRLYRYCRNPMYWGVVFIVAGEAILWDSVALLVYAAVLWLAFHVRVLTYEEPHLRKTFGAVFDDYCRAVPRWLPTRRPSDVKKRLRLARG